jgi:uncharacterized membrane protein
VTTTTTLGLLALGGSAITMGVLLAVAISLVPVFLSLPAGDYVGVHKVAGRYFDRFMPPTVMATTVVDIVLAVRSPLPALPLFVLAALFLIGVSLVSQFGNVPINRAVKALPAGDPPGSWPDPRGRWRAFHLWRTGFATAALITNLVALYLG